MNEYHLVYNTAAPLDEGVVLAFADQLDRTEELEPVCLITDLCIFNSAEEDMCVCCVVVNALDYASAKREMISVHGKTLGEYGFVYYGILQREVYNDLYVSAPFLGSIKSITESIRMRDSRFYKGQKGVTAQTHTSLSKTSPIASIKRLLALSSLSKQQEEFVEKILLRNDNYLTEHEQARLARIFKVSPTMFRAVELQNNLPTKGD